MAGSPTARAGVDSERVIIMTSNIGSQYIVDAGAQLDPKGWERVEERVRDELRNHFRPEFLNRVDDIIVFRQLSREDLVRIVDLQLARLEHMLAQRRLHIEVTPEAKALIAAEGSIQCTESSAQVGNQRGSNPIAFEI